MALSFGERCEGTSPEDWKRLTWLTRHLRGSLQRP
ncbi:hypothetical protein FHS13_001460 [Nocardiopsis algeriensis]|uniref:Uncharacterized protein n=1 Tax=Nocardiopsis algeriensis TaxID=1478215 RepID=A0A841ITC8_9ACTN|nr:hypothetical protein [Nocardiopsis algeriensis]